MAGESLSTRKIALVNNWLKNTLSGFLPSVCILCGRVGDNGRDICSECEAELPYSASMCPRCAIPIEGSDDPLQCGQCQQSAPSFDRAWAAFHYQSPVDHLIQALKFGQKLHNARLLGELMAHRLSAAEISLPEVILPVPLHGRRLRERGFNQALELARPIAKALSVPLAPRLCRRTRDTSHQIGLDAKARQRNLKGAFEAVDLRGIRHIAIVDDVMTTGSTAEMLAKTLKQAGAEQVDLWVCARAEVGR